MVKMVREGGTPGLLRRLSSDEVARRRFLRRCDVRYWYVLGVLAACQLTIVVCFLQPFWLTVRMGRLSVSLGVWGYCISVEAFEECEYFYKVTPWHAQSTVLRLFQLQTIFVALSVVSVLQLLLPCCGGARRWQNSDADVSSRRSAPLCQDLLLVLPGILGLGVVIAFHVSLVVCSTTDDERALQLLEDRSAGWALIVSIVAYTCRLLFSVIFVAYGRPPPATDLGLDDDQLTSSMEEVKVDNLYEIIDWAPPASRKRSDRGDRADRGDKADRADRADRGDKADRADRADRGDKADRTSSACEDKYENTAEDRKQTAVAGDPQVAMFLDRHEAERSWMETQLRKREEMEQMVMKKKEEEISRQREEEKLRKLQETKETELRWGKPEVGEKEWERAKIHCEESQALHTQTEKEAKSKQKKEEESLPDEVPETHFKEQEDEERTLSGEEREICEKKENTEQAGSAKSVADGREEVKVLIPGSSSKDSFKRRRKKRKFCCSS